MHTVTYNSLPAWLCQGSRVTSTGTFLDVRTNTPTPGHSNLCLSTRYLVSLPKRSGGGAVRASPGSCVCVGAGQLGR
ncbi:hypothetical protein GN956_G4198 [Arapaima gigas]